MNTNTLIFGPLIIMLIFTALSVSGLGTATLNQEFVAYQSYTSSGVNEFGEAMTLNDRYGTAICYYNGTSVHGESGYFELYEADTYPPPECAWKNSTTFYQLFYDTTGDDPVYYYDISTGVASRPEARVGPHWEGIKTFNLADSWGWLALVAAIAAVATFVGLKFFGSGESETSLQLLLKSTFFITVWVTLSLTAYPLILLGGFFVFLLYFAMTLTYSVGVILSVGSG